MVDSPYSCFSGGSPFSPLLAARIGMVLPVFVFLLVVCLLLSLALLWCLACFHFRSPFSQPGPKRPTLPRLRHPPAAQTIPPPVDSPPLSRRVEGQHLLLYALGARSKAA